MDFAVLGPLRCTVGSDDVTPQRRREAALLCALLLDPGASIPAETLAAAVWHDAPPESWPKALQMHVLRLRETIGRSQIETTGSGYRLTAPAASIDACVFERELPPLLATAAPLDADAEARLSEQLARWRGVPFEELGEWPPAVFARRRLRELRADALDARGASRVTQGVASVAELTDLVDEDPLREQRWELLMLALYRAGRQTEALQAFQRARKTLTVEFGLEPGPELVALERAILDHDARLDARELAFGARGVSSPLEFQRQARDLFDRGQRAAAIATIEGGLAAARARNGDPRSICEAAIDLAEFARAAGEWERANEAVDDAVRLARGLDDPALLARAALAAAGAGWITTMDPVRSPAALLEEALERLPSAPSALRARLHARKAVAESGMVPVASAAADSEEALRLAGMVGDTEARAVALQSRLVVDQDIAHLAARRTDGRALLDLADAAGAPAWRAWALPELARVEAMRGDLAAADAHLAELEQLADELDDPVARYHAAYRDVLQTTVRSDYAAAIRALERARDAGMLALPDPSAAALAHFGSLGIIWLLQGVVPESMAPMQTEWPQPTMDATYRAYFAVVSAQRGDRESAEAAVAGLDAERLAVLPHDPYWASLVWLLSVAFDALGDREKAQTVYDLAVPFADVVIVDLGATFLGAMAHHLGVLATTFGADRVAAGHFAAALEVHERIGAERWATSSRTALDKVRA